MSRVASRRDFSGFILKVPSVEPDLASKLVAGSAAQAFKAGADHWQYVVVPPRDRLQLEDEYLSCLSSLFLIYQKGNRAVFCGETRQLARRFLTALSIELHETAAIIDIASILRSYQELSPRYSVTSVSGKLAKGTDASKLTVGGMNVPGSRFYEDIREYLRPYRVQLTGKYLSLSLTGDGGIYFRNTKPENLEYLVSTLGILSSNRFITWRDSSTEAT